MSIHSSTVFSCAEAVFQRFVGAAQFEILQALQLEADLACQLQTGGSDLQPLAFSTREFRAEEFLQLADLAAHEALPRRIAIRRTRYAAHHGDVGEVFQALEGEAAPGE